MVRMKKEARMSWRLNPVDLEIVLEMAAQKELICNAWRDLETVPKPLTPHPEGE